MVCFGVDYSSFTVFAPISPSKLPHSAKITHSISTLKEFAPTKISRLARCKSGFACADLWRVFAVFRHFSGFQVLFWAQGAQRHFLTELRSWNFYEPFPQYFLFLVWEYQLSSSTKKHFPHNSNSAPWGTVCGYIQTLNFRFPGWTIKAMPPKVNKKFVKFNKSLSYEIFFFK